MDNLLLNADNLGVATIIINLLIAFGLSLILAMVYKNTHKGLSYSQSFLFTLILGGIAISAVMMIIGNSLARAFGAFGAFSVIRFRTAIKDTKDMAYIFLVLVIGMAVGTSNYVIAFAVTIFAMIVIYSLTKIDFGSIRKYDYILHFLFKTESGKSDDYKQLFDKYLKTTNLIHIDAKEGGKILKMTFNIRFLNESESSRFLTDLGNLSGVDEVNMINAKNDIEY